MMDFVKIETISPKKDNFIIYPEFKVGKHKDIMIKGKSFYAVWDEEEGLWSTNILDVAKIIDKDLKRYYDEKKDYLNGCIKVKYMSDFSSNSWKEFIKYTTSLSDNYIKLDEKLTFSNSVIQKDDYVSKRLPYPFEKGKHDSWDELVGILYSEEEKKKIEWSIGAVVSGDSKRIQKFVVFYGAPGSGKSTILNIMQKLFDGYYCLFEASELTSNSNVFSTESFRNNPLVAIQQDGDLSRIENNSKLNSIVSHDEMQINEKFKSTYSMRPNCFLFMATNKPVKITDAKSGIIRRLIDIQPSGEKIPIKKYNALTSQIDFELGAIAEHCLEVYRSMGKNYYNDYKPIEMMFKTDLFYNFVEDSYDIFKKYDGTTLKESYEMYKEYCKNSGTTYELPRFKFREELKNYFDIFEDRKKVNGQDLRNVYTGFIFEKFENAKLQEEKFENIEKPYSLTLDKTKSIFDKELEDYKAQYANDKGTPLNKWSEVNTKLKDIDTSKTHYVKLPENHIVIDFDLKDDDGNKSLEKNLEAASLWPPTYAEYSKSGCGIHLHYIYTGDTAQLSRLYSTNVEIKVFNGNSSLRRKLTKCNDIPIATISSGLPLKKGGKVINFEGFKSEKSLRSMIEKNLRKEIHPGTKPSIDFIYTILKEAHDNGLKFDVSDMRTKILAFAANSTHQSDYCVNLVNKMIFKSDEPSSIKDSKYLLDKLAFFDVEVFPNLFIIVYKLEDGEPVKMINPTQKDIEPLLSYKLVGFNCRRYDNHIIYARFIGYSNEELFKLSQKIIEGSKNAMFGEAYNLSYADIYDFTTLKQSLKKYEIDLGLNHKECNLPWDKPVEDKDINMVADYCVNDVIATEATFKSRKEDFIARKILADISGLSVNDTTQSHTARIIFGTDKNPNDQFIYTDLATGERSDGKKDKNCFPGYYFDAGKSFYKGEEVGEGGYVYAEPGMYNNVALLDIASMHPTSLINLNLFGPYTNNFKDILDSRILIKHNNFEEAGKMFGGKLKKYLTDDKQAKKLSNALKIVINSVYGYTSAKFDNKFKDIRNVDNIVAKRGALFMIDLKEQVQKKGFTVAHIKTDSIKIPNATPEIIKFVQDFGKKYGYSFEHEATYEKMCLVNDAVYIAKYSDGKHEFELPTNEKILTEWTATGTQFQVPYVFKSLFSKTKIFFRDMCETKSVTSCLYLDFNEGLQDVSDLEIIRDKIVKAQKDGMEFCRVRVNGEMKDIYSSEYEKKLKELNNKISKGHNYQFIGKVGLFCPMKDGVNAGELVREKDGKYYSATGCKGYRWLESNVVESNKMEKDIDENYFRNLIDDAIKSISQYGDFEQFSY